MQFSRLVVSVFARKSIHGVLMAGFVLMGCGGGAETATGATPTAVALASPPSATTTTPVVTTPVVTAPAVVTTTGTSSAVNVALSANRVTGVAPLAVFFDATGTTSSATSTPFHEIKYSWVFGDPAGNVGWSYGSRVGQSSKNEAYGAVAAHVFEIPGTYTVTVSAFDGTNTNSKTTTITVTDPNVVYSGANTICVANGSTPVAGINGCPVGASVRNLSTLQAVVQLGSLGNKRILLKRDDQWNVTGPEYLQASNGIFGAYGSGAAPLIRFTTSNDAFMLTTGISNWTFMDLEFVGAGGIGLPIRTQASLGSNITALRLRSTGTGGISIGADGVAVVDCNLSEMRGGLGYVGIYSEHSSRVAILGNRVYDATAIEHNIRMQGATKVVISNNTVYGPAATKQGITVRGRSVYTAPAQWSGVWVEHVVISDNDVDAGPNAGALVEFAPMNGQAAEYLRDVIFERNYVHGNTGTLVVSEVSERATIRNNIFLAEYNGGYGYPTIYILHKNTAGTPNPTSHYIYNNSFYQPSGSSSHFLAIGVGMENNVSTYPVGTVAKNNLVYAPYATGNGYYNTSTAGPILIGTTGPANNWTISNNSTDFQIKNTYPGFTVPPKSVAAWRPTSGYGISSGVTVPVWDDFFLKPQTSSRSLGAVLP